MSMKATNDIELPNNAVRPDGSGVAHYLDRPSDGAHEWKMSTSPEESSDLKIYEMQGRELEMKSNIDSEYFDQKAEPPRAGFGLIVKGVGYQPKGSRRPILDNITFVAKPGVVTAIAGPSGCGKTTLLNIIADRFSDRKDVWGSVALAVFGQSNKRPPPISYVMSKEAFCDGLTVKEVLKTTADLKLGHLSKVDRNRRVEYILCELELNEFKNQSVGNRYRDNLSLETRKRLALGVELIDEPPIILLDEPTTGLDARMARNVVQLLKRIAEKGNQCIICTIHQPRPSSFELFDNIILMNKGCIAYNGAPSGVVRYFESLGSVKCPLFWSPVDFAVDVIWAMDTRLESRAEHFPRSQVKAAALRSPVSLMITEKRDVGLAFVESELGREQINEFNKIEKGCKTMGIKRQSRPWKGFVDWISQFFVLMKRSFVSQMRDRLTIVLLLIVAALQAAIFGGIFWQFPDFVEGFEPMQIANVSQMILPYDNPIFQGFVHGADGHGLQPLLNAIQYGVDGQTSSLIDSTVFDESFMNNLDDFADLLSRHFKVDELNYPSLEYLDDFIHNHGNSSHGEESFLKFSSADAGVWIRRGMKYLQLAHAVGNSEYMHNVVSCLNFLDHEVDPDKKFYACTIAYSQELIDDITKHYGWKYPTMTIRAALTLWGYHGWLNNGVPPHRRLQETSELAGLDKAKLAKILESYGALELFEEIVGTDLWNFVEPVREVLMRFMACESEICKTCKAMLGGYSAATDFISEFMIKGYETATTMFNLSGVLFFITLFLGFASYDVLLTFPKERSLFNRETVAGLYSPSAYYLARMAADIPFQIIPSSVLTTLLYFAVGLHKMNPEVRTQQFFIYWGVCILITFCAYSYGYMISAVSSRLEVAVLIAPIFLMIWLTISGFFLRDNDLPNWIIWFKVFSFYRWGFFALTSLFFKAGGSFGSLPNEFNLALSGIVETRIGICCIILFACGCLYRLLAFVFLKNCHRKIGLES